MSLEDAFYNTSDYEPQTKELGKGTFGTVYLVKNIKDNKNYAAKAYNIYKSFDGKEQMLFLRESMILRKVSHPSIVKFYGINFNSLNDPGTFEPTIITEYLSHGSLRENLDKEKKSLSDSDWTTTKKYIILLGISDAMRYLHEKNIVHRDLKPGNILIDSDYYPRISDFGLSKCFPDSITNSLKLTLSGKIGTPLYMAPELLDEDNQQYDPSVDVYAFSMIAYEIITGKLPFIEEGKFPFDLANKIINGYRPKFTKNVTNKMKNLLSRCWSNDPHERPTFKEIFEELSSDSSYFNETVDDEEIQDYLEMLSNQKGKPSKARSKKKSKNHNKNKKNVSHDNQSKKLKPKSKKNHKEKKKSDPSDSYLCSAITLMLGEKKYRNINQAVNNLKISSDRGNNLSSFLLGLLYESGAEIEQNMNKSFEYYEKSFKDGNTKGLHRIGRCYHFGIGVKQDYDKAKEYYEQAVKLDDSNSMVNLGLLYENGHGVEQDYNKAKEYYEHAIELGNSDAMFYLGVLYENGYGVKKDYIKAKDYYEQAIELGDSFAMVNLGVLYEDGQGVKQDYIKAKEYYERAIELVNSNAMVNLGFLYKNGYGVKQNYTKAKEYYEQAIELGNSNAMVNLGFLYKNGYGVRQDYLKAKEYYERAIELGNYNAMANLRDLYDSGFIVKRV